LKNRINLAFGLALLILAVVAFASYRNIMRLRADVTWMEHTYQTSRTIRILFLKITEAETGQRGFVISANQAFVERFSLAEQSIPATLDALRELTKDNPRQQRRLDTVQQFIAEKLAFAQQTIALRRDQGLEPASQLVGTGRGEHLMDQISALIAEMQQEESQLLAERGKATDRTIRETTWVIAAGLLLAFLVGCLALLGWILVHQLRFYWILVNKPAPADAFAGKQAEARG
jgi:CHASE3 domain sensor protein